MEKLLYYRSYKTNPKSQVLCAHKTFYDDVQSLLSDYEEKRLLIIDYFEDGESVSITRKWDYVEWYDVYTILKDNGYTLTGAVETKYKYLEQKRNESIAKENERKEREQRRKEEIAETKAKYKIVCWCSKYDCETTLEFCNKCWYRKKYLETCQPIISKVEK